MPVAASGCKDLKVIFADGSGAQIDGTDNNFLDFKNAVSAALGRTNLTYDFYELGSETHNGYRYPATGIGTESLRTLLTTVGAYFSAGESYSYGESVAQGMGELYSYINEVSETCAQTKFILSGFSQGAGVISESLPVIDSEKIVYVATFGDAKLYLPEGQGLFPDACRGKNLSPYREYVPDCRTYQGILQGLKPYQPDNFDGKLGVWCNHHDIICTSYINWVDLDECMDPHGSYGNSFNADHVYEMAAETIYEKVLAAFGGGNSEDPEEEIPVRQNVAFLIDATHSMHPLIESYKNEAARLANVVFENGGAVALYTYRDLQDSANAWLLCSLETCTQSVFQAKLNTISVGGGGDRPESLLPAAMRAMTELHWEHGATKSIVVLTDAGYHDPEVHDGETITLQTVVEKSLEIDPINFYTITPPGSVQDFYRDLTEATNGKSFSSTNELDFSTEFITNRPDVKLAREEYVGGVNQEFFFDASGTVASADIAQYDWDLDFDGVFETSTAVPYVSGIYTGPTTGYMRVKATDENGLYGTMSAKVTVLSTNSLPTLEILNYAKSGEDKLKIEFQTNAFRTMVVLNDVIIGVTDGEEITISDFDFGKDNVIVLAPYDGNGSCGEAKQIVIEKNSEVSVVIYDTNGNELRDLVAPNCGKKREEFYY